ncbi:MAG: GreA/GreB family elongation factor [bacterium]
MADWSELLTRDNGGVWEGFRERLKAETPAEEISSFLDALHRKDRATLAEDIATEWETTVTSTAGRDAECLAIWHMRAGWEGGDTAVVRAGEKLCALYRKDGRRKRMVEGAGFDKGVALDEAFRRLRLLLRLAPQMFVLDKTWGFGVVHGLDDFYGKVVVNFARKQGHEVTFAYAGENFELLDEAHFYARNHRDPQGIAALVKNNPDEVIKLALRSFGPLTAPKLQELLCPTVMPEKDWKVFWDNARKALKNDPCVSVPAKRSEPLQLLSQEKSYSDAWFVSLSAERDIDRIFGHMKELAAHRTPAELTPAQQDAIGERLAYVIHARGDREAALRIRAIMAAAFWGVASKQVDTHAERQRLLSAPRLLEALQALSAREGGALLAFLTDDGHAAELTTCLIELLPDLPSAPLNEAMDFLIEHKQQTAVAERLRALVNRRTAGVELLYWLARHTDIITEWKLGALSELPFMILAVLEPYYNGDQLRTANQLEARLQDREWLSSMTATMNHLQRTSMVQYLRDAAGRTTVDTQSLIARLVMLHPELNELLAAPDKAASQTHSNVTSWRKHRERQLQLQKLMNEEIPQNSRDIGQARSYGDLSENYEFKAAKEQQSILMHRQAQWEADLQNIHGTDFRGFASTVAGIGVTVALEYPDGRSEIFHILGEWDQDLALGIISCSSRMGQVLKGHKPGDDVLVPGVDGDQPAHIVSVKVLPDTILAWARGD